MQEVYFRNGDQGMLKAIGILVAICLLTIQVSAQQRRALSKPPIPGAGEIASPDQQKPAAHDQPAADHERGTPAAPLIVEMQNPPNTDAITGELKKNRENQAAENGRSLIFDGLLVFVGILQAAALFFTVFVTNKAANAASDAVKVAKDSLIIATRPRITISALELCIAAQNISFSITNEGGIAIIDRVDATVQATRGRGGVTVTKPTRLFPLTLNREIEPRQSLGKYWIALDWISAPDLRREIKSEEATLTIIFQIISKDMFGKNHPTPNIPFDFDHRKWVFEPSRLLHPEKEQ
jgi:hypothetical protein